MNKLHCIIQGGHYEKVVRRGKEGDKMLSNRNEEYVQNLTKWQKMVCCM